MKAKNRNKFVKGSVGGFDASKGWFLGQFMDKYGREDLQTEEVEVCWKVLKKGYRDPLHYHKKGTEIAIVVSGWFEARVEGEAVRVEKKDFLVVYPEAKLEVVDFEVRTEVVVVKAPSVVDDKFGV